MGTQSDIYKLPACSEADLKVKYRELVDGAKHDRGHGGYTGTIAESRCLMIPNKKFMSRQMAEKYLFDDEHEKGTTLAVKVVDLPAFLTTTKGKMFEEKIKPLAARLNHFDREIVDGWKQGKTKMKNCPSCRSTIAVAYLAAVVPGYGPYLLDNARHIGVEYWASTFLKQVAAINVACPVCKKPMPFGLSHVETKVKLAQRIVDIVIAYNTARTEYEIKAGDKDWYWLVGGMYSS